jgi:primary-amine oxidase
MIFFRYDAPAYATYVATNYHVKETKWTNPNSIAIFEFTADHPLQRHTTSQYTSISRNTYLVIKSVSTGKWRSEYTFCKTDKV